MGINIDFKKAVTGNDVSFVRIMLKDSMVIDPNFYEFEQLIEYAQTHLRELYDEHDGEVFPGDTSTWNENMLNEQMVNVVYNFSKERIEFLKRICRHVYSDRVDDCVDSKRNDQKKSSERNRTCEGNKSMPPKQIGTGLMIGGGVVVAAGVVASQTILTAVGVTAAAVGAIVYYNNR